MGSPWCRPWARPSCAWRAFGAPRAALRARALLHLPCPLVAHSPLCGPLSLGALTFAQQSVPDSGAGNPRKHIRIELTEPGPLGVALVSGPHGMGAVNPPALSPLLHATPLIPHAWRLASLARCGLVLQPSCAHDIIRRDARHDRWWRQQLQPPWFSSAPQCVIATAPCNLSTRACRAEAVTTDSTVTIVSCTLHRCPAAAELREGMARLPPHAAAHVVSPRTPSKRPSPSALLCCCAQELVAVDVQRVGSIPYEKVSAALNVLGGNKVRDAIGRAAL